MKRYFPKRVPQIAQFIAEDFWSALMVGVNDTCVILCINVF